jgi:replicative DNA helicase
MKPIRETRMSKRTIAQPDIELPRDDALASERIVLGGLIDRLDFLPALQDAGLGVGDFVTETHRRIFRALCAMHQQNIPSDIYSVSDHLEDPQSSDLAVLADLIYGVVVEVRHAIYHAQQIVKKSRLRQVATIGEWMTGSALERGADPDVLLNLAFDKRQEVGL